MLLLWNQSYFMGKEYLHNFKGLYFDSYLSENVSGNSYAGGT